MLRSGLAMSSNRMNCRTQSRPGTSFVPISQGVVILFFSLYGCRQRTAGMQDADEALALCASGASPPVVFCH